MVELVTSTEKRTVMTPPPIRTGPAQNPQLLTALPIINQFGHYINFTISKTNFKIVHHHFNHQNATKVKLLYCGHVLDS